MMRVLFSLCMIWILMQVQGFTQQPFQEVPESVCAGDTREVYLSVEIQSGKDVDILSKVVSVDNVKENIAFVYAGREQFEVFLTLGYSWNLLVHPGKNHVPEMREKVEIKGLQAWDFYPSYPAYLDIMEQFAMDHPDLCQVFSIGQSEEGREIMMARISDNPGTEEGEPQFLYTATMHGDETVGYILSLHLIDHLLSSYGSDPRITAMVNNIDIWINPLANPDGTYAGGNNTVYGATRYNANGIDLNRNFPDPEDGPHPDGNPWQKETLVFMQLAENNHFTASSNMHGGAELCNYPWDTWPILAADNDWWVYVCYEYADTAQHYGPPGYFDDLGTGVTNGYAWYTMNGGRQDYMNYFHQCREFTLEMSETKLPPANQLENFWEYNYRSLLNYMEQSTFGIHGAVTDSLTGLPLKAEIYIEGFDTDSSWVYSNLPHGDYHRLLFGGQYDLTFKAPGYFAKTIENVSVVNRQTTALDVELTPGVLIADFYADQTHINVGTAINYTDMTWGNPVSWNWTFEGGTPSSSTEQNPAGIIYAEQGQFDVSLTVSDGTNNHTVTKNGYIVVSTEYLMQNTTITACEGTFFDSGGSAGNYGDDEDYTMTFVPALPGAMMRCEFITFQVEYHANCNYDWLKIYDGENTASPLIGTYCGTDTPGTALATGASGALTFRFHSDYAATEPGWKAVISCQVSGQAPLAGFTADITTLEEGGQVAFTDISQFDPESWQWEFEGGTPAFSSLQNPVIVYETPGVYDVTLTVSNSYGSDTETIAGYITVTEVVSVTEMISGGIIVFPNPVSDGVRILSPVFIEQVEFYNTAGKVALAENVSGYDLQISTSGLQNGLYILHILTKENLFIRKLTVIK
ncbi:MAG: PKD domain-containing protein [Bacteroidales bacterium]|nr:PKD domain-containing protein [Bacteroidales bacterium]